MKFLPVFFILLYFVQPVPAQYLNERGLKGKVKTYEENYYSATGKSGLVQKQELIGYAWLSFNQSGNLTRDSSNYTWDKTTLSTTLIDSHDITKEYDKDGKLISERSKDKQKALLDSSVYFYEGSRKARDISWSCYRRGTVPEITDVRYYYDDFDNQIRKVQDILYFDDDSGRQLQRVYEVKTTYNDRHKPIKAVTTLNQTVRELDYKTYDRVDSLEREIIVRYEEGGGFRDSSLLYYCNGILSTNIAFEPKSHWKSIRYYRDKEHTEEFTYVNDSLHEKIVVNRAGTVSTHYERNAKGQLAVSYREVFRYDAKGQLLSDTLYYGDGRIKWTTKNLWDKDGLCLSSEQYYGRGDGREMDDKPWTVRYVNTYDKAGNMVKVVRYENGILIRLTEYNIEYYPD